MKDIDADAVVESAVEQDLAPQFHSNKLKTQQQHGYVATDYMDSQKLGNSKNESTPLRCDND